MPWVRFEPTIPAFEQAKAVHALDRAATVIGHEFARVQYKTWVVIDGFRAYSYTLDVVNRRKQF
jgi:hypothetical protein